MGSAGRLDAGPRAAPALTEFPNGSSFETEVRRGRTDMGGQGLGSSLRRRGAPTGAVASLALVLAVSAPAATPAPEPDAPPLAVAPEAPPATRAEPVPVRRPQVVVPAPVVRQVAPVVAVVPTQPAATPAPKPSVKPKAKAKPRSTPKPRAAPKAKRPAAAARHAVATPLRIPHDRGPVPLAALRLGADSLDRGLLAIAGLGLLLVTLGGGVVLASVRRELRGLAA